MWVLVCIISLILHTMFWVKYYLEVGYMFTKKIQLLCDSTPCAFFMAFSNRENPLARLCAFIVCLLLLRCNSHEGEDLILFTIVSSTPICLAQSRSSINMSWMNDLRNEWTDRQQSPYQMMAPWPGEKVRAPFSSLVTCVHLCALWFWFCREWHHSTGQLSTTSLNTPKCCWRRGQTPPLWIKTLKRLSTGQSRWGLDSSLNRIMQCYRFSECVRPKRWNYRR